MPRAPRRCPGNNYQCPNLITTGRYCAEHTVAWQGPRTASSRATSQRAWKERMVPFILDRDHHQCQLQYPGICTGRATTSDKIIPASRRPDLAMKPDNNRAACQHCNQHKARTEDQDR